jgi:elongation factor G
MIVAVALFELHIEYAQSLKDKRMVVKSLRDRLRNEFKVAANIGRPQVAYRETIKKRVEKVVGKFSRQSGGKGQYGHVVINIEPATPGEGFVFEDKIVGGTIPREFIAPSENGMREALENGVIAGYPMVDV